MRRARRRLIAGAALLGLAACAPPGPKAVSADELAPVGQDARIQGRDGGTSALLWGLSVWTFGDTVLNVPDAFDQTWHHNSVGWTNDVDGSDGVSVLYSEEDAAGAPVHLLPPTPDEQAFNLAHQGDDCLEPCGARQATWPGAPVWIPQRDQAVFFYGLIHAEPGPFHFEGVGSSLATWDGLGMTPQRPVIDPSLEHPDRIWGPDEPGWGIAPTVIGDDLYVFACEQAGLARPCFLQRAPVDRLQEHDAWTVRTRTDWSADLRDAVPVFDGAPIASIAWNAWLGAWLAVYSRPFSDRVVARTAPELWGPWSAEGLLFTDPSSPYDAIAHAEFDEDDGRVIYVSFSRGTDEGWFGTEHAWVRVALGPD